MMSRHSASLRSLSTLPNDFPTVGRVGELARVRSHVATDGEGAPPALLVRGEAGVGKTRLIRVAAEAAADTGRRVFRGSAYPLDSGLSFGVWADGFVPFLRSTESRVIDALTRGRVPELFALFPAAADGGATDRSIAGDPEDARATLYWSFSELLVGLSRRDPILVVLEDLQWADTPSIQLLHFVIRQLDGADVRFICSSTAGLREGKPSLLEVESSLARSRFAEVVELDPLSNSEVEDLVSRTFAVAPEACGAFVERLHEWSGGNPLFVTETLRSLVEEGHLELRDGTWFGWEVERFEPPREVRDLVASRLARLSDGARRALEVAVVMGDRIRFAVLASVAGFSNEEALDALDELRHRGILEEREGDAAGRLVFTHPLMRECIYRRLSAARARNLHGKLGEALERELPAGAADRADELAFHFHRSGESGPAGKALRYLVVAGRRALDLHADEEATRHLGAALEIIAEKRGITTEAPEPDPARIMEDYARALERLGRYEEAVAIWKRALREASGPADRASRVELRRRLALACFRGGRHSQALAHCQAGLAEVEDLPLVEGQIRLVRALCLQELARWDAAFREAESALELAEAEDDPKTRTRAHQALALHHMWTGEPVRAREHAWKAIGDARRSVDVHGAFRSHWGLAVLEGLTGNLAALRDRIDEAREIADELRSPILELWIDELSLQEAHARGDWEKAVVMGERSMARARALGQRSLLPRLCVWTALPLLGRGDLDRGRELVQEAWVLAGLEGNGPDERGLDLHAAVPAFIGMVDLHLSEGDVGEAIHVGELGLEMARRRGSAIWSIHHLIPLLAQAYLLARDLEGAQRVGRRLRSDSERMDHLLGFAWADACDALVTWLSGDIEAGAAGLRAAADRLDGIPMAFDGARVRRQLAGRLAELGRRDEALEELRKAHRAFRKLGAEPELEKTRGMFREMETRPPPKASTEGRGGLTGRELEVARAVATRKSNKAIAKELDISPRTVTTHLTNIYSKLELGSRGELVDLVRDRGWA